MNFSTPKEVKENALNESLTKVKNLETKLNELNKEKSNIETKINNCKEAIEQIKDSLKHIGKIYENYDTKYKMINNNENTENIYIKNAKIEHEEQEFNKQLSKEKNNLQKIWGTNDVRYYEVDVIKASEDEVSEKFNEKVKILEKKSEEINNKIYETEKEINEERINFGVKKSSFDNKNK